MNIQDQLNLFCFVLGFTTGASCVTFVCLFIRAHYDKKLKKEGERLLEKMIARKQVDFFFNETVRLFILAAEAQSIGDFDLLGTLIQQHSTAAQRFQDAKTNLLQLEQHNDN